MSIQNLLRTSRSNYGLQFASLYRLTSIRRYSTNVDETQANNIQTNANVKDKPITNTSDTKSYSMNAGRSNSFANRRRARDRIENQTLSRTLDQRSVPPPSSMLRNWENSPKKLHLNFWKEPYTRLYQNIHISKLPISVTHQDIEMLTQGIYPDNENPINKIFMVYNDYYKPTGSAWIQFNHSRNASLFAKYVNQKTFYGNKLNVELMKYIPEEIQMDPLNYRVGKCIILAGLPRDVTKSYLEEYLIQKSNKRFELADVTREAATISDTSKWLILSNSSEDIYFIFDRIHNKYFDSDNEYKLKARVVR
ncbi:uncharacterized protein OCT59_018861 [Rhizophagus irregularis]|nr:hypothetical protein OCT59_018861 [Rhizophagus irregularis]GBC34305.1 hypothetical protein GLOIN_2v1871918 [Rhizophagus irregularis DAOM 181602=DAOM 197198]CAB4376748.1 unnamed protein product [Rhizophagus irregularis]CAB4487953.1 unnamed protein product [Rhizophagus irregularis]CAB5211841.1 unnamed protein product [Rhizophagus irregularis]